MTTNIQRETFLTAKEAAFILRISERTVRHLLNKWRESNGTEGIPGGFKVGSDWRVSESVMNKWIDRERMFGLNSADVKKDVG